MNGHVTEVAGEQKIPRPSHESSPRENKRIWTIEKIITARNRNMLMAAARPILKNSKAVW